MMNGMGELLGKNGNRYVGGFRDDVRNGFDSVEEYLDGARY